MSSQGISCRFGVCSRDWGRPLPWSSNKILKRMSLTGWCLRLVGLRWVIESYGPVSEGILVCTSSSRDFRHRRS